MKYILKVEELPRDETVKKGYRFAGSEFQGQYQITTRGDPGGDSIVGILALEAAKRITTHMNVKSIDIMIEE